MISVRDDQGRGFINVEHVNGRRWEVYNVFVHKGHRGKGVGHAMLVDICRQADEEQVVLELQVSADHDGLLTDMELVQWYGRHGFAQTVAWFTMRRMPRPVLNMGAFSLYNGVSVA
jgi:GNAT superfamily N-acetyltransferase